MARFTIVALSLTQSFAADDDDYYHTQLLQTKMNNPQKVTVDAAGEQDDVALFQKTPILHNKFKFFGNLKSHKFFSASKRAGQKPGKEGESRSIKSGGKEGESGGKGEESGGGGSMEDKIFEMASAMYGPAPLDVDSTVEAFMDCAKEMLGKQPKSETEGYKYFVDCADAKMAPKTNLVTQACEQHAGDVDPHVCALCSMKCECNPQNVTECVPCFEECAAGDDPAMDKDAAEECKRFYGDGIDVKKCIGCSVDACVNTDESMWADPNVGMRAVLESIDECLDATNALTTVCEEAYGEEVGLFNCMMCGDSTGCDLKGECDHTAHADCMDMMDFEEHTNETDDLDLMQTVTASTRPRTPR